MALEKKHLATAALFVGALALLVLLSFIPMKSAPTALPTITLTAGDATIIAEAVTTPAEQEQGLSGRTGLPDGRGMLFVFPSEGKQGIWMKDMKFPLDIVWADQNGLIVTVEHDVSPDSYPQIFYPSSPAAYVLEIPAGYAAKHGIAIGTELVVK